MSLSVKSALGLLDNAKALGAAGLTPEHVQDLRDLLSGLYDEMLRGFETRRLETNRLRRRIAKAKKILRRDQAHHKGGNVTEAYDALLWSLLLTWPIIRSAPRRVAPAIQPFAARRTASARAATSGRDATPTARRRPRSRSSARASA